MEKSSRKSPNTPTLIEQHLEELNTYLPSSGCLRSASNFENEVLVLKLDALMIEAETMKDLARHEEKRTERSKAPCSIRKPFYTTKWKKENIQKTNWFRNWNN